MSSAKRRAPGPPNPNAVGANQVLRPPGPPNPIAVGANLRAHSAATPSNNAGDLI